jgi:hypothetical protein
MGTNSAVSPFTRESCLERLDDLARRARLWTLGEQILNCEAARQVGHTLQESGTGHRTTNDRKFCTFIGQGV